MILSLFQKYMSTLLSQMSIKTSLKLNIVSDERESETYDKVPHVS